MFRSDSTTNESSDPEVPYQRISSGQIDQQFGLPKHNKEDGCVHSTSSLKLDPLATTNTATTDVPKSSGGVITKSIFEDGLNVLNMIKTRDRKNNTRHRQFQFQDQSSHGFHKDESINYTSASASASGAGSSSSSSSSSDQQQQKQIPVRLPTTNNSLQQLASTTTRQRKKKRVISPLISSKLSRFSSNSSTSLSRSRVGSYSHQNSNAHLSSRAGSRSTNQGSYFSSVSNSNSNSNSTSSTQRLAVGGGLPSSPFGNNLFGNFGHGSGPASTSASGTCHVVKNPMLTSSSSSQDCNVKRPVIPFKGLFSMSSSSADDETSLNFMKVGGTGLKKEQQGKDRIPSSTSSHTLQLLDKVKNLQLELQMSSSELKIKDIELEKTKKSLLDADVKISELEQKLKVKVAETACERGYHVGQKEEQDDDYQSTSNQN
ncbi:unnamed protein product [Ambrosiozyma monospora]|uniref:Unnamed protein product n=1 Tax=Ambrosiozyma monospora TaxID=43982 RepID=A0ACB5TCG9_AMBMO|nr:unnamed protein product [Ambrosiozyma monospora]